MYDAENKFLELNQLIKYHVVSVQVSFMLVYSFS